MKKIFVSAFFLAISAASYAGTGPGPKKTAATAAVSAPFRHIVISHDIDLVLTEATDNRIEVKGCQADASKVEYSIRRGTLYISSTGGSLKGRVAVHLSVNRLSTLEVNGESNVTTEGFLNSALLRVLVNGEAHFELKNRGRVEFEGNNEIELHFSSGAGKNNAR